MSDDELLKFALEFREGILDGQESTRMCFIICDPLEGLLKESGIAATRIDGNVEGWDHCWLELGDGRILDPTADQFPNLAGPEPIPPVFLGLRPHWYDPTPIHSGILKSGHLSPSYAPAQS